MTKRISIVTWIGSGNYGTALQAYALQRYLQKQGHDVSVLCQDPFIPWYKQVLKVMLYRLGILHIINKIRQLRANNRQRHFYRFAKHHYNMPTLITPRQIHSHFTESDVFISGSDQIWNSYYMFNPFMFLNFQTDKRKVAYASSIGTGSVNPNYASQIKAMLLDYEYIGVREDDAVRELSSLTGRSDIVQVLDPTLLLNAQDWKKEISDAGFHFSLPERYILCYLIGKKDTYQKQVEDVKRKLGIADVLIVASEENKDFRIHGATIYSDVNPLEFVGLLSRATMVCTDSFHATAFCINLHVDFVEFLRFDDEDDFSQNSRIYNVLDHYKLRNRLYSEETWQGTISYRVSDEILATDRRTSEDFLRQALH